MRKIGNLNLVKLRKDKSETKTKYLQTCLVKDWHLNLQISLKIQH